MALGLNAFHTVRDVPVTRKSIHTLLAPGGLFISKSPCLGIMNPLVGLALLPFICAVCGASYVGISNEIPLCRMVSGRAF